MSLSSGTRVGVTAFAPLPAETGLVVPMSVGTLTWKIAGHLGMSVLVKAAFHLDTTPMRPAHPEPIHVADVVDATGRCLVPSDLVPRRAGVDVVLLGPTTARTAQVRLTISQRGVAILDVARDAAPGAPSGLGPMVAHGLPPLVEDPWGGPAMVLPQIAAPDAFQCAPFDQRAPLLDPDAHIAISGVFFGRPMVLAQLPSARAAGVIFGADPSDPGSPMPLSLRADTLGIDPERMLVTLVWRAEIPLHPDVDASSLVVAAGVATHEHPLRLRRRLADLAIEPRAPREAVRGTSVLDLAAIAALDTAEARGRSGTIVVDPQAKDGDDTVPGLAQQGTQVLDLETIAAVESMPFAALPKPKPAAGLDIRAWASKTSSGSEPQSAPASQAPMQTAPEMTAFGDPDATSALGAGPVSLPFDRSKQAEPPAPDFRVRRRALDDSSGTMSSPVPAAQAPLPFTSEAELKRAELAKKLEEEEKRAAERRASERRAREKAEREKFEADNARLKELEAERNALAQKAARDKERQLAEALYGAFKKKKPTT
ncbi:MAG: DUF2169 domain-containing protein [Polyangiaceae bacterium]